MKLILTHPITIFLAALLWLGALLSPAFVHAANSQSSIIQEIITSSVTGNQSSTDTDSSTGSTHTNIHQRTVVNGKVYEYHFATSTPGVTAQQILKEDTQPVFTYATVSTTTTSDAASITATDEPYQKWISNLWNFINSLQHYVAHSL